MTAPQPVSGRVWTSEQNDRAAEKIGPLLDDLRRQTPDLIAVLVVSTDGILIAGSATPEFDVDKLESMAAMGSGQESLATQIARLIAGGPVDRIVVEMQRRTTVAFGVGGTALLMGIAGARADIGQVAFDLATLVQRVGPHLQPEARESQGPVQWPQ